MEVSTNAPDKRATSSVHADNGGAFVETLSRASSVMSSFGINALSSRSNLNQIKDATFVNDTDTDTADSDNVDDTDGSDIFFDANEGNFHHLEVNVPSSGDANNHNVDAMTESTKKLSTFEAVPTSISLASRRSSTDILETLLAQKMRQWVVSILVLNFDLELGHAIEYCYPTDCELGEEERRNIRFSAFPDANSSSVVGDTVFSFRTQASEWTRRVAMHARESTSSHEEATSPHPPAFLYGYVFFRQQKDTSIRRGYLQKSIVVLSVYPWPGLFLRVAAILGPLYFGMQPVAPPVLNPPLPGLDPNIVSQKTKESPPVDSQSLAVMTNVVFGMSTAPASSVHDGRTLIEQAGSAIAAWPAPTPGAVLNLPFFDILLEVQIPSTDWAVQSRGGLGRGGLSQLLETSRLTSFRPARRESQLGYAFRHESIMLNGRVRSEQYARIEPILASVPCSIRYPCGVLSTDYDPTKPPSSAQGSVCMDFPATSLGCFYRFLEILEDLWLIWELVLTGESIIVMGRNQAVVSESVWWLTDLISPIPFAGDFRPFFTIQDSDFKTITERIKHSSSSKSHATQNVLQHIRRSDSIHTRSYSSPTSPLSTNFSHAFSSSSGFFRNKLAAAFSSTNTNSDVYSTSVPQSPSISTAFNASGAWNNHIKFDPSRESLILGVTNPFFVKALEECPHIIRVGGGFDSLRCDVLNAKLTTKKSLFSTTPSLKLNTTETKAPGKPYEKGSSLRTMFDFSPKVTSPHSPFLAKDNELVKTLYEAYLKGIEEQELFSQGQSDIASPTGLKLTTEENIHQKHRKKHKGYVFNEVLRRHFVDLTERFLVPLNRYFSTLIPVTAAAYSSSRSSRPSTGLRHFSSHSSISQIIETSEEFQRPPPLYYIQSFVPSSFMKHLVEYGPPKLAFRSSRKTSWTELYSMFLKSPHFQAWLLNRQIEADRELWKSSTQELCAVDMTSWRSSKSKMVPTNILLDWAHRIRLVGGYSVWEPLIKVWRLGRPATNGFVEDGYVDEYLSRHEREWYLPPPSSEQLRNLHEKAIIIWELMDDLIRERLLMEWRE